MRPEDRGSVSLFVVLLLPALIITAGLVLDGGRQLQTRRDADGAAAAAARAAVQLSPAETRGHHLDPVLAAARAQSTLASMGYRGSVSVAVDSVTVEVSAEVTNLILPGGHTVTGSATVVPERGVLTGG